MILLFGNNTFKISFNLVFYIWNSIVYLLVRFYTLTNCFKLVLFVYYFWYKVLNENLFHSLFFLNFINFVKPNLFWLLLNSLIIHNIFNVNKFWPFFTLSLFRRYKVVKTVLLSLILVLLVRLFFFLWTLPYFNLLSYPSLFCYFCYVFIECLISKCFSSISILIIFFLGTISARLCLIRHDNIVTIWQLSYFSISNYSVLLPIGYLINLLN